MVTRDDVTAAARPAGTETAGTETAGTALADLRPAGRRTRVSGVRKATAGAMVASAFTAPHVTEWVWVDVTRTMKLVRRLRREPEFADVRVSPLLLVARALLVAVRRHPGMNASWQDGADGAEIVTHPR